MLPSAQELRYFRLSVLQSVREAYRTGGLTRAHRTAADCLRPLETLSRVGTGHGAGEDYRFRSTLSRLQGEIAGLLGGLAPRREGQDATP